MMPLNKLGNKYSKEHWDKLALKLRIKRNQDILMAEKGRTRQSSLNDTSKIHLDYLLEENKMNKERIAAAELELRKNMLLEANCCLDYAKSLSFYTLVEKEKANGK